MQHIGVLIDFSDLCLTSIAFAKTIAKRSKSKISLIHALDENESERSKIECAIEVAFGDYEIVIPRILSKSEIDMVVVGTHGIHGLKQILFGSNILHLIQKLPIPTLVVQKNSPIPESETSEILFPMSPHSNFMEEVIQTAHLAKAFNSKVIIYTILKVDAGPGDLIEANRKLACNEFKKLHVPYVIIDEPATSYSFGYGKQIVQFGTKQKVNFISIMSHVSSDLAIMGNADKEKIILNESFIPVFCVNN